MSKAKGLMVLAAILLVSSLARPLSVGGFQKNCHTPDLFFNQWAGITNNNPTSGRYGSRADILATTNAPSGSSFRDCYDDGGADLVAGSSAWVAVVPAIAPSLTEIVQIGITRCTSPNFINADEVCNQHAEEFRFFWAAGGCGVAIPYPRSLGLVPPGTHNFKVQLSSTSIGMYIDNAATIPPVLISRTDPGISCWAQLFVAAEMASERWDEGDSWGGGGDETLYSSMQVKTTLGGSWVTLNYPNGCHFNDAGQGTQYHKTFCIKPSGSSMKTYD